MAITYKDAILEQAPAANTTIYTAPSVDSAHIMAAKAFNTSASNVILTGNIVKSGDSVGNDNQYINVTVPAGRSKELNSIISLMLNAGDFISFNAGTTSALNIKLTIKEITS